MAVTAARPQRELTRTPAAAFTKTLNKSVCPHLPDEGSMLRGPKTIVRFAWVARSRRTSCASGGVSQNKRKLSGAFRATRSHTEHMDQSTAVRQDGHTIAHDIVMRPRRGSDYAPRSTDFGDPTDRRRQCANRIYEIGRGQPGAPASGLHQPAARTSDDQRGQRPTLG